ncbi:hypothetical protein ACQ4PT_071898 [Festuca glaucescens]
MASLMRFRSSPALPLLLIIQLSPVRRRTNTIHSQCCSSCCRGGRPVHAGRAPLERRSPEDADALDCGVCYLPLKPPIFQCAVGHVVCSPCRDKLLQTKKCHVCRVPTSGGGYRRSHGMEKLVEAIRVPCANAAYGCAARPAYYDHGDHLEKCPHAPCYCPAERKPAVSPVHRRCSWTTSPSRTSGRAPRLWAGSVPKSTSVTGSTPSTSIPTASSICCC